jgi:glycosyltransferase involved in cell wall biosynthesis
MCGLSEKMKVGFDTSQTGNDKAGCGYFADSLILALTRRSKKTRYMLYPHFGYGFCIPDAIHVTRNVNKPNVQRKLTGKSCQESFEFWKKFPAQGEDILGNPDIVHSNNYFCPTGLTHARIVYTLHDLSFVEYPDLTTEENRNICFEGVFNAAVFADFIIAVSAHTREVFLEIFPHYPQNRIKVVHEASRFISHENKKMKKPEKDLMPSEFWLTAGTLEPRKNLRRLIKAFAMLKKDMSTVNYPLVLVGGKGWLEEDLENYIHELSLTKDVRWLGYLPDEELCWLYNNCFSFVYPSLYEGFGLPVLEAMGFGAAVITSETTSLPEVAGDAAHYVNPYDEKDICKGLKKILGDNDYRFLLKNRASVQAEKFSWDKCASEVFRIYENVMNMERYALS